MSQVECTGPDCPTCRLIAAVDAAQLQYKQNVTLWTNHQARQNPNSNIWDVRNVWRILNERRRKEMEPKNPLPWNIETLLADGGHVARSKHWKARDLRKAARLRKRLIKAGVIRR